MDKDKIIALWEQHLGAELCAKDVDANDSDDDVRSICESRPHDDRRRRGKRVAALHLIVWIHLATGLKAATDLRSAPSAIDGLAGHLEKASWKFY